MKQFKFSVEHVVEAVNLEQAKCEFQAQLDNGIMTLDTVDEWNVRDYEKDEEEHCKTCGNKYDTFTHRCPYEPEHFEELYGCMNCDDKCDHCMEFNPVTHCSKCELELKDFVHQCSQNHSVIEKHGCPHCDDHCGYCVESASDSD
jgi:hypothetical protein